MLRGLHVNNLSDPAAWAFIRQARPALVKVVNPDADGLRQLREAGVGVLIARFTLDAIDLDPTPQIAAERWWRQLAERLAPLTPYLDYLEVPVNEAYSRPPQLGLYAAASARFVELAAGQGIRCLVGNFSVGCPEMADWHAFLPALQAAKKYGGALSLHEYGLPTDYGKSWWIGRWRWLMDATPAEWRVSVYLTEYGVDGGLETTPRPRLLAGWRGYGMTGQDYAAWLAGATAIEESLDTAGLLRGCALFNLGDYDNKAWRSFDADDPALVAWVAAGPRVEPLPPPVPEPPPVPGPEPVPPTEGPMRLLHPWPVYNQLDDWTTDADGTDENRVNNCGPECAAMCVRWATGVELPADFVKDAMRGPAYTGVTTLADLETFLTRRCAIPCQRVGPGDATTPLRPVVERALADGYPVIVLMSGNGVDLAETVGHFMVVIGADAATVLCADPWGGALRTLTWARFEHLQRLAQTLIIRRQHNNQLAA